MGAIIEPSRLREKAFGLALMVIVGVAHAETDFVAADELEAGLANVNRPLVIDVRSPAEFAAGHVPGALSLPIQTFPGAISGLSVDKAQTIVVYCEKGPRAGLAKAALSLYGYSRVKFLDGHMQAWRAAGRRLVRLPTSMEPAAQSN
jgi:rhodanese-related sulfurtransferase